MGLVHPITYLYLLDEIESCWSESSVKGGAPCLSRRIHERNQHGISDGIGVTRDGRTAEETELIGQSISLNKDGGSDLNGVARDAISSARSDGEITVV